MSFRRATAKTQTPTAHSLEHRLQKEFESPSSDENAQPIILAEPPEPAPISRLFVIWDDWAEISLQDRSEIIMNAYIRAKGQPAGLRISVAMGLTSTEAKHMGIT